eukprot:9500326-Prorocentrum_lima.AAC.1
MVEPPFPTCEQPWIRYTTTQGLGLRLEIQHQQHQCDRVLILLEKNINFVTMQNQPWDCLNASTQ